MRRGESGKRDIQRHASRERKVYNSFVQIIVAGKRKQDDRLTDAFVLFPTFTGSIVCDSRATSATL